MLLIFYSHFSYLLYMSSSWPPSLLCSLVRWDHFNFYMYLLKCVSKSLGVVNRYTGMILRWFPLYWLMCLLSHGLGKDRMALAHHITSVHSYKQSVKNQTGGGWSEDIPDEPYGCVLAPLIESFRAAANSFVLPLPNEEEKLLCKRKRSFRGKAWLKFLLSHAK